VGGVSNGYFSLKEKTPFNNVPPHELPLDF
jgi:hypothetical protein